MVVVVFLYFLWTIIVCLTLLGILWLVGWCECKVIFVSINVGNSRYLLLAEYVCLCMNISLNIDSSIVRNDLVNYTLLQLYYRIPCTLVLSWNDVKDDFMC